MPFARQARADGIEIRAVVDDGLLLPGLQRRDGAANSDQSPAERSAGFRARSAEVTVEAARADNGTIRLAVSDQGPGLPEETQTGVFEPFFTTQAKGTGLGLAIVRKKATHLGGQVRIESSGQGGALITVTLPEGPQPAATATE